MLAVLFSLFISFSLNAKEPLPKLKVGYIHYPPFTKVQKDILTPTGFLVEHIEKSLAGKYKVIWVRVPIVRVIESLEEGFIDIFPLLMKTPAREKVVDFSKAPLFVATPLICGNFSKSKKDVLISYPNGSVVLKQIKDLIHSEKNLLRIEYNSGNYATRVLELLKLKRLDLVFFPETRFLVKKLKELKLKCKAFKNTPSIHVAFKKGSKFREEVNIKTFK